MTIQISTRGRNGLINGLIAAIGASPTLQIRAGLPPANPAAAAQGALLASPVLPATWMAAAANGVASKSGSWEDIVVEQPLRGAYACKEGGGVDRPGLAAGRLRALGRCRDHAADQLGPEVRRLLFQAPRHTGREHAADTTLTLLGRRQLLRRHAGNTAHERRPGGRTIGRDDRDHDLFTRCAGPGGQRGRGVRDRQDQVAECRVAFGERQAIVRFAQGLGIDEDHRAA